MRGEKGKEKSPESVEGSSPGGNDAALTVITVAASRVARGSWKGNEDTAVASGVAASPGGAQGGAESPGQGEQCSVGQRGVARTPHKPS